MSEREEIPGLSSDSRRGKKPFPTKLDEHTSAPDGKTMDPSFQTSYGSSLAPTSQDIRGLQKGTTNFLAHPTQETGSPGASGGEPAKSKKKNKKNKKGKGRGPRSGGWGARLAEGESSGFAGSVPAPHVEDSRIQSSEIPSFSNWAASEGLRRESYDNHWHGSTPALNPASSALSWARGGSGYPGLEDLSYSQEGNLGWRRSSATYSTGSWGHYPEGRSGWAHGVRRLQSPSQQQFPPNPESTAPNPPSSWQQQQPRGHHDDRSQHSRSPWGRRSHDHVPRLSGNSAPLPAPVPTKGYLAKSLLEPQALPKAPKQLLVLDLNGTLVYRRKGGTAHPVHRPELGNFLSYIFTHFSVMVWTSAQPENAQRMVSQIFTKEQKNKLLAVWARDTLQLTPDQYRNKTTVYKRLTRIWAGEFKLHFPSPDQSGSGWGQTNTILIDDSSVKAAGQPYNLIRVPEFVGDMEGEGSTALSDCVEYLNELRFQDNVSAYIRHSPFYGRP